jgi:hypothetical protein
MTPRTVKETTEGGLLIRDLLAVADWMTNGNKGVSSEYLLAVALGGKVLKSRWGDSTPFDEPDLGRCLMLIERAPSVRNCFPILRTASPVWATYIDHWDELAELHSHFDYGATTARMRALRSLANVKCAPTGVIERKMD